MDIIKELEAMHKRIILEVNAEFNRLIEQAQAEGLSNQPSAPAEPTPSIYSLTAGTRIFKGTKPEHLLFPDGRRVHVHSWKGVVAVIMEQCLADPDKKRQLLALRDNISGRKRLLLSWTGRDMRSPLELCDGLYMETHYDTETLLYVLTSRILDTIHYDYSGIQIALRN